MAILCAGSPEVMTLVYKAVQRGYAVVAVGAHRGGDKWRCYQTHWPPEEYHEISGVSTSSPLISMGFSYINPFLSPTVMLPGFQ